jgi:hypothetical protein
MARSTPNLYPVHLSAEQRDHLEAITRVGKAPVAKVPRARVLLLSEHGREGGHWTEPRIAEALGMHRNTGARIRKRFVTEGEATALDRKVRRCRRRSTAASRPTSWRSAARPRRRAAPAGRSRSWPAS